MKARGAVLTRSPLSPPYAESRPLDVVTVDLEEPRGELLLRPNGTAGS